jgi:hypothetical protein
VEGEGDVVSAIRPPRDPDDLWVIALAFAFSAAVMAAMHALSVAS